MFGEYSAENAGGERLTLPEAHSRAGKWVEGRKYDSRTIAYTLSQKLGNN